MTTPGTGMTAISVTAWRSWQPRFKEAYWICFLPYLAAHHCANLTIEGSVHMRPDRPLYCIRPNEPLQSMSESAEAHLKELLYEAVLAGPAPDDRVILVGQHEPDRHHAQVVLDIYG